jgi:soluble P-type ATPase
MVVFDIPGRKRYQLHHLVLDVNGTMALDGCLMDGVVDRLGQLSSQLEIHLLTADTHNKQNEIDTTLGMKAHRIRPGSEAKEKANFIDRLGPESVVAMGNGANDEAMMDRAELSVAVLGPEGLSVETLNTADVVVNNINDGLDLLLYPDRLTATLRK